MTRFRLFLREPEAIFWIFVFPILLAVGLGIAFRNRPADVLQVGATTAQLAQALAADKGLTATDDGRGARARMRWRRERFCCWRSRTGRASCTSTTTPTPMRGRRGCLRIGRSRRRRGGRMRCAPRNELVHETGSRYIDFVVPGLLGMNLMGSAMWGLGFAIVEARQKKLLKRMVASPMPRWQYLASFLLSRLVMLVIEVVVFLGFARLVFGVPFRGSLWELGLLCVLTSLAFSALGLLVASRAKTMEAGRG